MRLRRAAPSTSKRTTYEIVVRGELSERFASTFRSESLGSTVGPARVQPREGTTAIVIDVIDQTHLLAIPERLCDLPPNRNESTPHTTAVMRMRASRNLARAAG